MLSSTTIIFVLFRDGGQVGLDGAGRLAILLHLEDIGGEVPAADVLQLLQMVHIR